MSIFNEISLIPQLPCWLQPMEMRNKKNLPSKEHSGPSKIILIPQFPCCFRLQPTHYSIPLLPSASAHGNEE